MTSLWPWLTVAGLGATALFAGADAANLGMLSAIGTAVAETPQRPVGFGDLVEKVKPAVISVWVKKSGGPEMMGFDDGHGVPGIEPGSPADRFFRQFGMPRYMQPSRPNRNFTMGQGSGFFISADGYAITNNHVVEGTDEIEVLLADGRTRLKAKVVGADPETDLAVLKVERDGLPAITFGSPESVRIGQPLLPYPHTRA